VIIRGGGWIIRGRGVVVIYYYMEKCNVTPPRVEDCNAVVLVTIGTIGTIGSIGH